MNRERFAEDLRAHVKAFFESPRYKNKIELIDDVTFCVEDIRTDGEDVVDFTITPRFSFSYPE